MWDNNAQGIQEICNCGHDQLVKDVEKGAEESGVGFEDIVHGMNPLFLKPSSTRLNFFSII